MWLLVGTVNSEGPDAVDLSNEVPRSMGILKVFESPSPLRVSDIIQRIMDHREEFTKRNKSKAAKEAAYITSQKHFVEEK